jgi:hypothetical protein
VKIFSSGKKISENLVERELLQAQELTQGSLK